MLGAPVGEVHRLQGAAGLRRALLRLPFGDLARQLWAAPPAREGLSIREALQQQRRLGDLGAP